MKKLLLILLCFPLLVLSQEEKRLALVIGNANYDKGELKNPVNDALLIAETLKQLEFDVILDTNLADKRSFKETIRKFGNKRPDYDVAFVYYAGHGIQVGSENYLLPTKEVFESEYDVQDYGVSVQDIMRYLTGMSNQVNVLILDACRDNPFEGGWKKTRSLKGDGLAKIPPPTGSLVAFSTDAGMTAADGDGKNSIYCRSLSENLLKEDIGLEQVFKNVRSEVLSITNHQQSPVESSKLTGTTFYLKKNFAVYNATIEEIFEASEMNLNKEDYYKSIEILNEAVNIFKKRGNKKLELDCRKKIIDNYFNKFRNSDKELHLFPLINFPSSRLSQIDVNTYFDFKSYNIFFDNIIYFSLVYEAKDYDISIESIYNFLVYVRYVIQVPVDNYGLNLELSQLEHSQEDYDRLITELKKRVSNYQYSSITTFWEFKLGYQNLRQHNALKGFVQSDITIVNSDNIYKEFFKDFYKFIEDCNLKKEQLSNNLTNTNLDQSSFFEKEIVELTLDRYITGIEDEISRMIIDLLSKTVNGETKKNLDIYIQNTNTYFSKVSNGFQIQSDIHHYAYPWIRYTLKKLSDIEVLHNGYETNEIVKLSEFNSLLLRYLTEYKEGLLGALKDNNQESLIKYSEFNERSHFDILGYYGSESYCFSNDKGLKTNYLYIIDSLIIPHIDSEISILTMLEKTLSDNIETEWIKETFSTADARHNISILQSSKFNNVSNSKLKKDIINLEMKSKLSEIVELDILPLIGVLEQVNVSGTTNGDLNSFYFFEWLPYIDQLSSMSHASDEDHLIVLHTLNMLRIKFSLSSPNFSWDIKDISDSYIEMLAILERTENHLVEFSIKKSIRRFIHDISVIYNKDKIDNNYQILIDAEIKILDKLL